VYLSVCEHIYGTKRPVFAKFFVHVSLTVAQSCSGSVAIRFVLPVMWTTLYYPGIGIGDEKRHIIEVANANARSRGLRSLARRSSS